MNDTGVPPDPSKTATKVAQVVLLLTLAGVAAWIAVVVIFIL